MIRFLIIIVVIIVLLAVLASIFLIVRECYHTNIVKNNGIVSENGIVLNENKENYIEKIQNEKKCMLAFSGGGFRSVVNCTGCLRGVVERLKRKGAIKNLQEFLNSYEVLSGNSGGAWFVSLLTYSKNYFNILNNEGLYNFITYTQGIQKANIHYIQKMYDNVHFLNSLNKILQFDDKVKKYTQYALNYYDSPWQKVIYDLVFMPVGDMNKMTAIGNNPNKVNYSIIIHSTILKEATLNQFSLNEKKSRINTSYSINEPSCCEDKTESCCGCKIVSTKKGLFGDCGFGLPIFIGWDHGSNSCQTSLYPGWYKTKDTEQSLEYVSGYNFLSMPKKDKLKYKLGKKGASVVYTEHDTNVLLHSGFKKKNVEVDLSKKINASFPIYSAAAMSSAAGAFVTCDKMLDYLLRETDTKIGVTKDLVYILDSHANLDISGGANIAHTMNYASVPLKLPSEENKEINTIEDGFIGINTPIETVSNAAVVKTGDGGYFDNSGIVGTILEWQNKNVNNVSDKIKIICVNDANVLVPLEWHRNNLNIGALFGIVNYNGKTGNNDLAKTYEYVFRPGLSLNCTSPQIFSQKDFKNMKQLYAQQFFSKKDVTLDLTINYYDTKTVKNKTLKIQEGLLIDLYVIECNTTSDIFISKNNSVDSMIYSEELLYQVFLEHVPEEIINKIFG